MAEKKNLRDLYRSLANAQMQAPSTLLLRDPQSERVFVVRAAGENPCVQTAPIAVPQELAEVVGWFAGKEVVRLRS